MHSSVLWAALLWKQVTGSASLVPRQIDTTSSCKLQYALDGSFHVGFENRLGNPFGNRTGCSPSLGVITGFMLFVDFPNVSANISAGETPMSLYNTYNVPGAMQWYAEASYGQLQLSITPDVLRFYRLPDNDASYTKGKEEAYFEAAMRAYETTTGKSIPDVDVIYVVHVLAAKPFEGRSFERKGPFSSPSNVSVKSAVALNNDQPKTELSYRLVAHETGHTMCLPDLYFEDMSRKTSVFTTVDGWDLMGSTTGSGSDFFGWNKWTLGWLKDDQVDCILDRQSTEAVLAPIERRPAEGSNEKRLVVLPRTDTPTALVFERRAKMNLDSDICAEGILVYTVDTSISSMNGPIQVIDTSPGTGGCTGGDDGSGRDLTDAPLNGKGRSFELSGWSVRVTIIENSPQNDTTIRIENLLVSSTSNTSSTMSSTSSTSTLSTSSTDPPSTSSTSKPSTSSTSTSWNNWSSTSWASKPSVWPTSTPSTSSTDPSSTTTLDPSTSSTSMSSTSSTDPSGTTTSDPSTSSTSMSSTSSTSMSSTSSTSPSGTTISEPSTSLTDPSGTTTSEPSTSSTSTPWKSEATQSFQTWIGNDYTTLSTMSQTEYMRVRHGWRV